MAQYLETTNLSLARARSKAAWESHLGQAKQPENITEFLYEVILHPDRNRVGNKAALVIPDLAMYTSRLTNAERNARRTEAEMETDGWIARSQEL